jgi:hypothetical protein
MRVADACRAGLFTVDINDSLEVAAHRMDQAQLGALTVVLVSERDCGLRDVLELATVAVLSRAAPSTCSCR